MSDDRVVVRFAPSPTGYLHMGNLRPALYNYLFSRKYGGKFILRYDDTDIDRCKPEYVDGIMEDLSWIGIVPDEVHFQSNRTNLYENSADVLKKNGRLYPAFETQDELERRRRRQISMGKPPIYDRRALDLSSDELCVLQASGKHPHWRFKLSLDSADWVDGVRGEQSIDTRSVSDPVVIRENGTFLYTFTSVVDDVLMGITHIIRGEDHVTNTGVQIDIFKALDFEIPIFYHHNLLAPVNGEAFSKRTNSLSLRKLRDIGYDPMTIASLSVLIGTSSDVKVCDTLDELMSFVDFSKLSRSTSKFDVGDIDRMNSKYLHSKSFSHAVSSGYIDKDAHDHFSDHGDFFWESIKGNITTSYDVRYWYDVVSTDFIGSVSDDDDDVVNSTNLFFTENPVIDDDTWSNLVSHLKKSTGRKGRELFHPLRLFLTNHENGPEMKNLIKLMGIDVLNSKFSKYHSRNSFEA